jgi:hypothetical protein
MESAFRLSASAPQGTREYAHRYTSDEWEIIKPKIEQFYVQEKKTLQQVIHILEQQYRFTASYVALFPFPVSHSVWSTRLRPSQGEAAKEQDNQMGIRRQECQRRHHGPNGTRKSEAEEIDWER